MLATLKLIKLMLPILVLNWLLNEAEILLPGSKEKALQVFEQVQIPTHDEWSEDLTLNNILSELGLFIDEVKDNGLKNALSEKINPENLNASYKKIDIQNLDINPDDIFNNDDLFASLDKKLLSRNNLDGIGRF